MLHSSLPLPGARISTSMKCMPQMACSLDYRGNCTSRGSVASKLAFVFDIWPDMRDTPTHEHASVLYSKSLKRSGYVGT